MDTAFLSFCSTLPEDACRLPNTPGALHPLLFREMASPDCILLIQDITHESVPWQGCP